MSNMNRAPMPAADASFRSGATGRRDPGIPPARMRGADTAALTVCALVAFAANSLLCRMALAGAAIDAGSFSALRLASGAAALGLIAAAAPRRGASGPRGDWIAAAMLFVYAGTFSFAYLSLSAGTGALILFAAVQATMILAALRGGERPHLLEWTGLIAALAGLVYLVMPGLSAPPLSGSLLMAAAGIAWGIYSLRGRGAADSLGRTCGNFARSLPFVLVLLLLTPDALHLSARGATLAVLSGSVASGLGYVVWYAALRGLTATRAAIVQLAVPVLAAGGGVLILSETVSLRLLLAAVVILGGVGLSPAGRAQVARAGPG